VQHWSRGLVVGSDPSMALRAQLAALFAAQPLSHWATVFESTDACVTPVLTVAEALAHPMFR
jgi:crotonobetainyl-CoA:carnitine CoA-transferase CaiB-like acyl-CoA transferase